MRPDETLVPAGLHTSVKVNTGGAGHTTSELHTAAAATSVGSSFSAALRKLAQQAIEPQSGQYSTGRLSNPG